MDKKYKYKMNIKKKNNKYNKIYHAEPYFMQDGFILNIKFN